MADSRYGDRQRPAYRRSDSIFDDDDRGNERQGGGSEGGFFQRAGEEVRSWLGGEDDDRGQSRSQGSRSGSSRSDYGAYRGGRSDADRRETSGDGGDWARGHGSSQGGGRGGSSTFDDHYLSWRERQIQQLDRDYEDYCRDRQKQFETDFHGWRESRQGQSDRSGSRDGGQTGATPDQTGVTSGRTGLEGQSAGSGSTTRMSDDQERSAATTAGGGGEASATESSTGSSAASGSGARTGRKTQDK